MTRRQAESVAALVGGTPEQTGGNVWVVFVERAGGRLVVVSDDLVAEYPDRAAYEAGEPTTAIPLG